MFKARLKIKLVSDWSLDLINKFNCDLKSLYCENIDKTSVLDIILFSNIFNVRKYEEVIEFLENQNTIKEFEVLDKQNKYLVCKIITQYESIIYTVLKSKCFSLSNIEIKNNFEYWVIGSSNKENIKNLINTLSKTRKTELLELKEYNFEKNDLSDKQYSSIKYAFVRGYFEIPKKIDLNDLSKELNISKSTLAVHVQKAEKKIIGKFLDDSNEYVRQ